MKKPLRDQWSCLNLAFSLSQYNFSKQLLSFKVGLLKDFYLLNLKFLT